MEGNDPRPGDDPPAIARLLVLQRSKFGIAWENAWWTGVRPRIEEHLRDRREPERSQLLRLLLPVDLEFRRKLGPPPTRGEYEERFPEHVELIRATVPDEPPPPVVKLPPPTRPVPERGETSPPSASSGPSPPVPPGRPRLGQGTTGPPPATADRPESFLAGQARIALMFVLAVLIELGLLLACQWFFFDELAALIDAAAEPSGGFQAADSFIRFLSLVLVVTVVAGFLTLGVRMLPGYRSPDDGASPAEAVSAPGPRSIVLAELRVVLGFGLAVLAEFGLSLIGQLMIPSVGRYFVGAMGVLMVLTVAAGALTVVVRMLQLLGKYARSIGLRELRAALWIVLVGLLELVIIALRTPFVGPEHLADWRENMALLVQIGVLGGALIMAVRAVILLVRSCDFTTMKERTSLLLVLLGLGTAAGLMVAISVAIAGVRPPSRDPAGGPSVGPSSTEGSPAAAGRERPTAVDPVVADPPRNEPLREVRRYHVHTDQVSNVVVSPDGRRFLSGSLDGTVQWWDLEAGAPIHVLSGHEGWVMAVALSPDGRRALSGGQDRVLRLWDLETGEALRTFEGHGDWIFAVAFTPDGRRALSSGGGFWDGAWRNGTDFAIRAWDVETGEALATWTGPNAIINALAVSADGRHALSASANGTVYLWDASRGQIVSQFPGQTEVGLHAAFSPSGRFLVATEDGNQARVWDLEVGREVSLFRGHAAKVDSLAISPDDRRVVSGSWPEQTLRLWDLATGRELGHIVLDTHPHIGAFLPDGRRVLWPGTDGTVRLIILPDLRE